MFKQTSASKPLSKPPSAKKSYLLAIAIASSGLTGLMATPMASQAASLGDLFGGSSSTETKFLPVDQAFGVTTDTQAVDNGTQLSIHFDITPEHYVYQDQIKFDLPEGVTASSLRFDQTPVMIDDPTYGKVAVFDQDSMVASTTLSSNSNVTDAPLTITWQGCAKAGLCYPPEKIKTTVSIDASPAQSANGASNAGGAAAATSAGTAASSAQVDASAAVDDDFESGETNTLSGADTTVVNDDTPVNNDMADESTSSSNISSSSATAAADSTAADSSAAGLDDSDPFGLAQHPWLAMALLFLAGLGLALTPCVLPMLPIVANIVGRQKNPTVKGGVILTASYAIGVSVAYGLLGAVIAVFGESLGIIGWLQNPIILISFAVVFVLLALYMLGVFSIRLPQSISSKMQALSQAGDSKLGSASGSVVAGFLSALVVSPCVSAPLFGALIAVSTIGNPLLGFAALFMLGFGLSAPLILIGATQGKFMPKAGEWMNWVKVGFSLLLFAVALLLIERVFVSPVMLLVWALWLMVVAMWAWNWIGRGRMLTQALALIAGIWATTLVIGASLGNDDSLQPLESVNSAPTATAAAGGGQATSNHASDERVTTLEELDEIIAANENVLVDVTADWCIECRIMDKNLFTNRPAQMQDWKLVRLDITETTEHSKAILARYQLFGPPALLYYQEGELIGKQVGEIGRTEFEQTLTELNK